MHLGRSSRGHLLVKMWCKIFSEIVPLQFGVHKQGVKRKPPFFIWRWSHFCMLKSSVEKKCENLFYVTYAVFVT